jgi:effector-binding domain-containing protein
MAGETTMAVEVKSIDAECVAYLPMTGPYDRIPAGFGQLYGWVTQRGLVPGGPPSGVYFTDPARGEAPARWELRAPLAGDAADVAVDAAGCGVKHVAPRLVAAAIHRGPYAGIAPAYAALASWIRAHGYTIVGPPEELYLSEPAARPEDTLTEIRLPVGRM